MTDSAVLVLNNVYQAVQITSVRRAFRLFYAGRARAVAPDFRTYDFENWSDLPPRAVTSGLSPRVARFEYLASSSFCTTTGCRAAR